MDEVAYLYFNDIEGKLVNLYINFAKYPKYIF